MEEILFASILEKSTVCFLEKYFDKPLGWGIKPPKNAHETKDGH